MSFMHTLLKLVTEGILPGVGSVLSFVPSIAILIFILALLRELGFIKGPAAYFIMGFSCSVPAILACNKIENKGHRYLTAFLIPYMSCSAKLPIYMVIASTFFPIYPYAAVSAIYFLGIVMAFCIYKLGFYYESSHCPRVALPSLNAELRPSVFSKIFMKPLIKDVLTYTFGFVKKAFTVVLVASIVIWFLQNLNPHLDQTLRIQDSLLAMLGRWISPIFSPLGFGDWRAVSALVSGLSAKEAVVSTFAIIAGGSDSITMSIMLQEIFTPLSAFSFMIFCLLYMPCISSFMAIKTLTKSNLLAFLFSIGHTAVAWGVSFLIFHLLKVIIQYIGGV